MAAALRLVPEQQVQVAVAAAVVRVATLVKVAALLADSTRFLLALLPARGFNPIQRLVAIQIQVLGVKKKESPVPLEVEVVLGRTQ